MRMCIFHRNNLWAIACAALLAIVLIVMGGQVEAQGQIPRFTFTTRGPANFNGDAISPNGALAGSIKFTFSGRFDGSRLNIQGYISRPEPPAGNTPRFWRLRITGTSNFVNLPGTPQLSYKTNDPKYNILTISNLEATEDFTRTGGQWKGPMKLVLRFSKVAGVPDSFSVEFTPVTPRLNPPPPARGTICNAQLSQGSRFLFATR